MDSHVLHRQLAPCWGVYLHQLTWMLYATLTIPINIIYLRHYTPFQEASICLRLVHSKTCPYNLHHALHLNTASSYNPPFNPNIQMNFVIGPHNHGLKLTLEQVTNHLPPSDISSLPQRGEIKRTAQPIRESKEQHGRNPPTGVLECKAAVGHLVLLRHATLQVVHRASGIHLSLVGSGDIGGLHAGENVEVVVGGVAASVTFGADCCAENDEVLGYTCVAYQLLSYLVHER